MLGPLLLLLVSIAIYWKLVLSGGQYTWLDSPDLSTQVLPWLQFQAREWNRGHWPLWDPYNWGGQSLAGRTEPGVLYPLNWILFRLPLDRGALSFTSLNWYYVLAHYLGALFGYWLCRGLGRSVLASVLAGTAFGLAGYVGATGWPQMFNGAIWAPLVILFFLRALRAERSYRNAALAGGFLGVSLLSGHHQMPVFVSLAVAGVWLYQLAVGSLPRRRILALGLLFAVFAILLGAAQILPSVEYGRLSVRWVGARGDPIEWGEKVPYNVHHWLSMNPVSVLAVVLPGMHKETTYFLGAVAVALALLGLWRGWGERSVRLFGAIALGGLLFAFGSASVFHGWIYALVPGVDKARNAAAAICLFHLGAAVLAAFGLDELRERFPTRLAVGLLAWSAVLYAGLLAVYFAAEGKVFNHWRLSAAPFAALLAGVVLLAWQRGSLTPRAARVLLFLILLFEIGNSTGADFRDRELGWQQLDKPAQHQDLAEFLRRQGEDFRVDIDRADIPYNFGEWYELEECGGNSGVTTNVFRASGQHQAHLLLGERFSVGRQPRWPGQAEVFQTRSGVKVYRNADAFPRVWTVHQAASTTRSQLAARLGAPVEQLRRETFVAGPAPRLESCEGLDEVQPVERTKTYLRLRARMACRGMVIVGDTYFPGWEVRVGGRPASLHEAYGFLRGVVVEAGEHEIQMRYRPRTLLAGAALSLAGMLTLLAVTVFSRRTPETDRPVPGR
jgi:hypothetical protein